MVINNFIIDYYRLRTCLKLDYAQAHCENIDKNIFSPALWLIILNPVAVNN